MNAYLCKDNDSWREEKVEEWTTKLRQIQKYIGLDIETAKEVLREFIASSSNFNKTITVLNSELIRDCIVMLTTDIIIRFVVSEVPLPFHPSAKKNVLLGTLTLCFTLNDSQRIVALELTDDTRKLLSFRFPYNLDFNWAYFYGGDIADSQLIKGRDLQLLARNKPDILSSLEFQEKYALLLKGLYWLIINLLEWESDINSLEE